MSHEEEYQFAYQVFKHDLVRATKEMNIRYYQGFGSRVVGHLEDKEFPGVVILMVAIRGSYPYITNQWEEFTL